MGVSRNVTKGEAIGPKPDEEPRPAQFNTGDMMSKTGCGGLLTLLAALVFFLVAVGFLLLSLAVAPLGDAPNTGMQLVYAGFFVVFLMVAFAIMGGGE